MRTRDETNALQRARYAGYRDGRNGTWPEWVPPLPANDPLVRNLIEAAIALRNAVDGELAKLDGEDEWQTTLGDPMDCVTDALAAIANHVDHQPPNPQRRDAAGDE